MLLEAKLKCNKDNIPYRIYIDGELITERFYTIASKDTVSNDLVVELVDANDYDVKIESLSDTQVHLVDYTIRKIPNENT
jgi:hypothetical protein